MDNVCAVYRFKSAEGLIDEVLGRMDIGKIRVG
jgi:hypothetical protein